MPDTPHVAPGAPASPPVTSGESRARSPFRRVAIRVSVLPMEARDPADVLRDVHFAIDALAHTDESFAYMRDIRCSLIGATSGGSGTTA